MRKGRSAAQASLNKALDDLLGPDDGEDDISAPVQRPRSRNIESSKSPSRKGGLTSTASNKDFYKNLSAIAGKDIEENNLVEDENIQVSSADAAQLASSLANMDDLESDLFGSFGGKKNSTGAKHAKLKKKLSDVSDFDEDDPLAGLGLSDDDNDFLSKKTKPKKQEPLSKKFSHTSSKGKVDPNLNSSSESPRNEKSLLKSTSFEKDDPFLATDPRPRSNSIDRKIKRLNSWDDPSIGTQSASESELTPRSRSNSGSQIKHERKGSNRKKKVNPSPPKTEHTVGTNQDLTDALLKENKPEKPERRNDNKMKNQRKSKEPEDIFADEDDLPGLSDDEATRPKSKVARKTADEDEPARKASTALSDLLGNKPKPTVAKSRKPSFLDQMMSKSTHKSDGPAPMETDSPVVSPREKDVMFGGYSPSASSTKDRPTTAPSRRSVRFADELGFDDLGSSFSESRPLSAPESARSRKAASKLKTPEQSFSFDDDATDVSLEIKEREFKNSHVKKAARTSEDEKMNASDKPKTQNGASEGQRRRHQKSWRTQTSVDKPDNRDDKDDWLGLDDNEDFPELDSSKHFGKRNELGSVVNTERKDAENVLTAKNDDWLGLGDEKEDLLSETGKDIGLRTTPAKVKEKSHDDSHRKAENATTNDRTASPRAANDDLFPWELSTPLTRERRRERPRQLGEKLLEAKDDANGESNTNDIRNSEKSSNDPIFHATPNNTDGLETKSDMKTSAAYKITQNGRNSVKQTPVIGNSVIQESSSIPPSQQTAQFQIKNQHEVPSTALQNSQRLPQDFNLSNPVGDSFAAQIMAAQRILSMVPNQAVFQGNVTSQLGPGAAHLNTGVNATEVSQMEKQLETINAEKIQQQKKLEELGIEKSHNERQHQALESEIRDLKAKLIAMEEKKVQSDMDTSKKIEELESKVRRYELEIEHWKITENLTQKRHVEEIKAMENSHKTRFKILEDTYDRRETQLKEEHEYSLRIVNEKLKAAELEKQEIVSFNKRKIEMIEKNKDGDIERIKEIQRKVIEDTKKDYEDQIERLRLLKEQEVAAATSMFSQTKSLQSLMHQVQNSATEVDQLQRRVDSSHKVGLSERELVLKARDEYLKSMQERLHQQEAENIEERNRLQSLIAKLEIQLQQQSRQQDQDKWKLIQDENRIKSMQAAFENERRSTLEQLNREREMVDLAREELSNNQKKIMSECYEERQNINMEKANLENAKMKYNKSNLEQEFTSLKGRETKIISEEQRLERERKALEQSFDSINKEKLKLEEFAEKIQEKSKQIEELSKEARRVQQEGLESIDYAESMKNEVSKMSSILESKALSVQEKENILLEERASLEIQARNFEREKETSKCINCRRPMSTQQYTAPEISIQNVDSRSQYSSSNSPASSISQSTSSETARASETKIQKRKIVRKSQSQTPDILINSIDFNRKLRKWSSDREQDAQFFEEESRYLNNIQQKRERSFKKR